MEEVMEKRAVQVQLMKKKKEKKKSLKTLRALQTEINKKKGTLAEDEKEPKKEMNRRRSKTALEERVRGGVQRRRYLLLSSPSSPIRAKLLPIPLNPPSGFNHQTGNLWYRRVKAPRPH